MKKVANRIQNTGVFAASRSVPSAAAMIGAVFGGGAGKGCVPSSPNGRRPTSLGTVAHDHQHRKGGDAQHHAHQPQRDPPAHLVGERWPAAAGTPVVRSRRSR